MNCSKCAGTYQEKRDLLEIEDPYVGMIAIQGVLYYKCDKCDDILYSEEIAKAIDKERSRLTTEFVNGFPVGDFMSAAQTASLLGISRQALHKNRRINHGFIYRTMVGETTFYLKRSVLQFKKIGDGRFPLYRHEYDPSAQGLYDTVPMKVKSIYKNLPQNAEAPHSPFRKVYASFIEENCYAN